MKPTVLVTGGAGYIGSHACKCLARAGYRPVAYDNLIYGHRAAVQWGPLVEADILDPAALDRAFAEFRPEAVMHFAAFTYVGESVADPARYYRNNVGGALCLLDAMRRHHCRAVIFSSTCATYGVPQAMPLTEDHPQWPVNPYGWTKLMIERALADYGRAYGMASLALRYFNAAGADPEGEIGEDHDPETHLIPLVLAAARDGAPRLTVFGDDYPTPDGTCVRDYIHVTDLAEAHRLGLEHLLGLAEPAALALNLGNGAGYSVREVIAAAERVTGRPVPHDTGPRRAGDPPALVGSSERARALLGWRPRFAGLETMLETAWRWHARRA
ncbi:MAG: UDP-glucose 4-epimerase GalE [Desulfovibrionaceae bacterium]